LSSDPGRYTQSKFQEARRLLFQHWDWVCTLRDALLEKQTLDRDEVVSLLGLAES
jgi:ATP-dependent Zn protease